MLVGLGQGRAGSTFKTIPVSLDTQVCPRAKLFKRILNSREKPTSDPGGLHRKLCIENMVKNVPISMGTVKNRGKIYTLVR